MAASATELATGYIQLIPSMDGAEGIIKKELGDAGEKAGDDAGKKSGNGFLTGFKGIASAAAALAVGKLFADGLANAIAQADTTSTLKARLGLSEAEAAKAGKVAGDLYANAYGESMADVGDAVDAVMSSIEGMTTASEGELNKVTAAALNLSAGFGVDVGESATTAGIMIKNGLAKDATEAFDMITAGMQNVPAGIRGEILPVMDEYSKHFATLGIDGETAMSMIVNASADGAIGMDKVGDAVKEFSIRATDMSSSTSDAYKTLGLDTKTMTNDLLAGGDTANDAMGKIVSGLLKIKDPGEQASAALALFGTPLEDLGVDQIPGFLAALDPASATMLDTAGAAEQFGADINSGPSVALEGLKRAVETGFGAFLSDAMPAITAVTGFLTENEWVFTAFAVVIGVLATAWGVYTVAQWAANSAMLASPITWVVLLIAGLVAAIVWIATQTTWFQDIWTAVWNWIKTAFETVVNWIKTGLAALKATWETVWNAIKTAASAVWEAIKSLISSAINAVWNTIKNVVGTISGYWSSTWNAVKAAASSIWSGIKTVISGAINGVKGVISGVMDAIKSLWSGDFNGMKDAAKKIWNSITSFFRSAVSGFGNIFSGIGNAISAPFRSAFNAVASAWNSTVGRFSFTVPGWVPGLGGKGWSFPKIPMLAAGGIVDRPTLSLIGEAGPEAVFPLDKLNDFLEPGDGAGGGMPRADIDYLADRIISGLTSIAEGAGMAHDLDKNARRYVRGGL